MASVTERVTCLDQHCRRHGHFHPCQVPDCPEPRQSRLSGYCTNHHHRWRNHGDPLGGRPYTRQSTCRICGRKARRNGYCNTCSGWAARQVQRRPNLRLQRINAAPLKRHLEHVARSRGMAVTSWRFLEWIKVSRRSYDEETWPITRVDRVSTLINLGPYLIYGSEWDEAV